MTKVVTVGVDCDGDGDYVGDHGGDPQYGDYLQGDYHYDLHFRFRWVLIFGCREGYCLGSSVGASFDQRLQQPGWRPLRLL